MKLNYKKILILGISFLVLSFTWSLYNSYVPVFLKKYIQSNAVIGFVMSLDKYAGLFIVPIFGVLSDRINTRLGRRMPAIMLGMTAAAVFMYLIPLHSDTVSLIISIIGLNISIALFRAPATALMADISNRHLTGRSYGTVIFMGGTGAIFAYFKGSYLFNINRAYPFYIASILLLVSLILLCIFIQEKKDSLEYFEVKGGLFRNLQNDKNVDEEEERERVKNILYLMLSVFLMFCAFSAVEVFFTIYGRYYLGMGEADSARLLTIFSAFIVIFALPAGYIGDKIGRKKAIVIGQSIMILLFTFLFFASNISTIEVLLGFAGVCWALLYANLYPLIICMTENISIGRFTGYYYLVMSLSAIVSSPVLGLLIDTFGYSWFFIFTVTCFILSLVFVILFRQETAFSNCRNTTQSDCTLT